MIHAMPSNADFQSAAEIGKVYQSLTEKTLLTDFFLESVSRFIDASVGYLFLTGRDNFLWLEACTDFDKKEAPQNLQEEARRILSQGKPVLMPGAVYVPLVVRNSHLGVGVFCREAGAEPYGREQLDLAFSLACQMASSLKNILLFEENLKMERLAAVGQTTGMVMHEIKNIMQLARFAYDFLERGIQTKSEKMLERGAFNIQKALKQMEGFAMDMLSLTKDYQLEPENVNLGELIRELEQDLSEKAKFRNIRLEFEVAENFPEVQADGRSLYRALLNLAKNALEACDKADAYVRVKVRSRDEMTYEITVEDNGQGMTPEAKARIFEAFFSTKGKKGTGLGVMIVDKTVKMHQGQLRIESELNVGTVFSLILPKKIKK